MPPLFCFTRSISQNSCRVLAVDCADVDLADECPQKKGVSVEPAVYLVCDVGTTAKFIPKECPSIFLPKDI